MEQLFSQQVNPNLDLEELEAMCTEFKNDYNQRHFVRNDTFKKAAEGITGETRKIFIEFLERSCTAEFSGFLLYKVRRISSSSKQLAASALLQEHVCCHVYATQCGMQIPMCRRKVWLGEGNPFIANCNTAHEKLTVVSSSTLAGCSG